VLDPERVVYGRHPLREAIRGPRSVHRLHLTEEARRALAADLPPGVPTVIHDTAALSALTGTPDHQGCAAEVDSFDYCSIDDLLAAAQAQERSPFVMCLDQVTDPHNLGAIARVCDAAGADGILIPEHRSARVTGAVCKASAGAIEHVKVAQCTNLADTLDRVRGPRIWAYGASASGRVRYTDPDYSDGVLLVLGSEGAGIRPRVERMCDQLVSVPMAGTVASLNVATVAALLAFEVVRQRG
jgi:23S rRNA (guanosine2251-2'-O)-methyltransferase